jgi:hypothetical protein
VKLSAVRLALGALAVHLLAMNPLWSQATVALSGIVADSSGKPVAHAQMTAKSAATGQAAQAETDASGHYQFSSLAPGDYEVSARSDGYTTRATKVSLTEDNAQTLNLTMATASSTQQGLPSAPAPSPSLNAPDNTTPSLGDLGFSAQQTQADPKLQAMLGKRTEMLKIHQRLGLITVIPMTAAVITGPMAKAKGKNGQTITEPTTANLDFHAALGGVTTALYFSTAYFAIFAPRVPGTKKHGAIRVHEALAFVHGPGMVLTPVLGYMAYKQENSGEKAHGIAAQHGTVAYITSAAYGASIVAVSWPIHWKFWEK